VVQVQVITLTESADTAHGLQTLLKGCEAAIRTARAALVKDRSGQKLADFHYFGCQGA
jgi:hypothetical protein